MGRYALVDTQKLEDLIVESFELYEQGLVPVGMRMEARNIIDWCKKVLDKHEE